MKYETKKIPEEYYLAPDCSEIRSLPEMQRGNMVHCTLPVGVVSKPVYLRRTEEIWYCIEGDGKVWRKQDDPGEVTPFFPGISLTIPTGTHFQFRNIGDTPLRFIIVSMPPWSGPSDSVSLKSGYWDDWVEECDG